MSLNYASLPRIYVADSLQKSHEVELSKPCSHYCANVLRRSEGDHLRLFNGKDGEYLATLTHVSPKQCRVTIDEELRRPDLPSPLTLIFTPLRKDRTHFLIEKAVELGVTELIPVLTERTTHRTFNHERGIAHIIEAAEQCERLLLPHLAPLTKLPSLLSAWPADRPIFFCKERNGARPLAQVLLNDGTQTPTFLVGPEGGFTPEECLLLESYSFVKPVSLGYHILRAETAALSALGFWKLYSKAQTEQ